MGRIVVTEFVSLDGVVEAPGGGEGYKHDGWSFEIDRGDEGNRFKLDETMATEALLLGRKTYEGFAAAWPSREGDFADKFNSMPKYVVSSTLESPEWRNTTVVSGDLAQEVAKLREATKGTSSSTAALARSGPARGGPRGRAAADGLPHRAGDRKAPVRRDERQEAPAAQPLADGRRRRHDPRLRGRTGRLSVHDTAPRPARCRGRWRRNADRGVPRGARGARGASRAPRPRAARRTRGRPARGLRVAAPGPSSRRA